MPPPLNELLMDASSHMPNDSEVMQCTKNGERRRGNQLDRCSTSSEKLEGVGRMSMRSKC